jgi:hypothetical protein
MEMAYAYGYRYYPNSTLVKMTPAVGQGLDQSQRVQLALCRPRFNQTSKDNNKIIAKFDWREASESEEKKILRHPIFVRH